MEKHRKEQQYIKTLSQTYKPKIFFSSSTVSNMSNVYYLSFITAVWIIEKLVGDKFPTMYIIKVATIPMIASPTNCSN